MNPFLGQLAKSLDFIYISEELVGMGLFDSKVFVEMKRLMLLAIEDPVPYDSPKRPKVKSTAFLSKLGLEQFCTINTKHLFQLLEISQTFLDKGPFE